MTEFRYSPVTRSESEIEPSEVVTPRDLDAKERVTRACKEVDAAVHAACKRGLYVSLELTVEGLRAEISRII